jgi:hypothetical protein
MTDQSNLDRLHAERMDLLASMVQELRAENEDLRARLALLAQHDADQRAALREAEGEAARMREALEKIDKHRVGAWGDEQWPDPCEECGEMRDIAAAALAATPAGEGR